MSGNFIYRHHVEPRVKLYSPREDSFPIPLKYIDVSRTTHTNLDVKEEKRTDDYHCGEIITVLTRYRPIVLELIKNCNACNFTRRFLGINLKLV